MREITLSAYAKVNLWLHVGKRRPDGFHDLLSVMQAVSLCDTVQLRQTMETGISLSVKGNETLPTNRENLAYRAAEAFLNKVGGNFGIEITIIKRIPVAAGLAGGSTDAAAVLKGMNALWGEPLDEEELLSIAATLGSDVPFCLIGGTCLAAGRGEVLSPLDIKVPLHFLLVNSDEQVSAKDAYGKIDEYSLAETTFPPPASIIFPLEAGDLKGICKEVYNRFEEAVLPMVPIAQSYKQQLIDAGAVAALMSGSGPTIFAIFESEEAAREAAKRISTPTIYCQSVIVH